MSLSKHNNIHLQRVCVSCHTFQLALSMLIYLLIAVCFQHAHDQLLDVLELVRRILQEHNNNVPEQKYEHCKLLDSQVHGCLHELPG